MFMCFVNITITVHITTIIRIATIIHIAIHIPIAVAIIITIPRERPLQPFQNLLLTLAHAKFRRFQPYGNRSTAGTPIFGQIQ